MKPVLQALILAERVFTTDDQRQIICGTFNGIRLRKTEAGTDIPKGVVPSGAPGAPYAYLSLTDICDGTELDLQFVSLTINKVLFKKKLSLHGKDRLATIEIVVQLPSLGGFIHGPGVYSFEVICEGEIIGSSRVIAEIDSTEG